MWQAYFWIVNNAILCPYYDIEYGAGTTLTGGSGDEVRLNEDMSYSSFVLVPMLTLFTCRRALLIGGPGGARAGARRRRPSSWACCRG